METNTQSHCWWFESHNTSNSSPWLQSTLSELNEKTKTMLKLVEEDADSFAQRAEMYYKKRPELISMVEDFYRAHRSLAERYDQLKSDRAVRMRSPLSQSLSLPKLENEYVLDSVKSFDSFTDGAYSSEESVESEVDDPEEDEDEIEIGKPFFAGANYNEVMKLREELDCLREENEIQKNIIKQKDEEKEEFLKRLSDKICDLKVFREVNGAVREENTIVSRKSSKLSVPFKEMSKLKDEMEKLEMENSYYKEKVKKKAEEVVEVTKMLEETKSKLMKLEQDVQMNNGYFKNVVAVKEENIFKITRQFEATKSELVKLNAALIGKETEMRLLKDALVVKDYENREPIKNPNDAFMENKVNNQQKKALAQKNKTDEKIETIRCLRNANSEKDDAEDTILEEKKKEGIIEKDIERNEAAIRQLNNAVEEKDEVIMKLNNALQQKDEEKREAIRQLSIAMEILREESRCLKKTLAVTVSPRKKSSDFQILKGVNLGKFFNLSSSCEASECSMDIVSYSRTRLKV